MDKRSQFVFYREYWDAAQTLPRTERLAFLEALTQFALDGTRDVVLTRKQAQAMLNIVDLLEKERRQSSEGRRSAENKQWRESVFKRDDYTCRLCKRRGVRLNAHHIKQYAHYPELRCDVRNGITLCEPCHKLVHRLMREGLL